MKGSQKYEQKMSIGKNAMESSDITKGKFKITKLKKK